MLEFGLRRPPKLEKPCFLEGKRGRLWCSFFARINKRVLRHTVFFQSVSAAKTRFKTIKQEKKMKKRVRVHVVSVALILFLLFAVSGQADVLSDIKAKGEMSVGSELQFAPFDFLQGGKHVGMNKDLFDEVGKELGVKIKFNDLPWVSILPGLNASKVDIVAGPVTITKARMERYAFTYPIAYGAVTLVKRRGDTRVMKPEDIAGKVVGVAKSSAAQKQLDEYRSTLADSVEVKSYGDANQAYSEIMTGRVVAVANQLPNIGYLVSQHKNFEIVMPSIGPKAYFGYVVRKDADSASLLEAINQIIVKMENDGRMKTIHEKWLGAELELPQDFIDPTI
jgi:polar amino acid transport system substrate-binding protein